MKSRISLTMLSLVILSPQACIAQTWGHKSDSEIAQLTPEGRVREYCSEYYHHDVWHREYVDLIDHHIDRDGLKAVPAMTQVINEFDPTNSKGKGREKDAAAFAAETLLDSIDVRRFRLRAFDEGKKAIDAVKRELERMRAAHFDTAPSEGEYSRQNRYEITVDLVQSLQGVSTRDESIRDTFELRYKVELTDKELLDFSNYLVSQDPYYTSWSETEWYVNRDKLNEAGNPLQYSILKNVEPFYKMYLKYKAKGR